jgi:hypothetical protein
MIETGFRSATTNRLEAEFINERTGDRVEAMTVAGTVARLVVRGDSA